MSLLLLLKPQPLVGYTAPVELIVIETSLPTYTLTSQADVGRPEVVVISS